MSNPVQYLMTELQAEYENTGGGCMTLTVPMPTDSHPYGAVGIIGKFEGDVDNFSGRTVTDADSDRLTGFSAAYLPDWHDPDDVERAVEDVYESDDFYADDVDVDMPDEAFTAANRLNAWTEAARTYSHVKTFMSHRGDADAEFPRCETCGESIDYCLGHGEI